MITIHQRYRQTDGQTDDMRSQYRALHYSASRGKKREDLLMCTLKILVIGYLVSIGSGQADKYLVKKYEDMHMLSCPVARAL